MAVTKLYFQSDAGSWDNLTIGQGPASLYGTAGTSLTATLKIPDNTKSLSLGYNVQVNTTATGPLAVAISTIDLLSPDGTVYKLYGVFYGGCTIPLILTAPDGQNNTSTPKDFTSEAASWAGQTVTLEVNTCIVESPFTPNDISWTVTAYMAAQISLQPATVTFNVIGGGQALPGVPVQITNQRTEEQVTLYSSNNGLVTYTGGDVGDDIKVSATFDHANTVSETVTIENAQDSFNITITCVTGYGFSQGTCQLLGGVTTGLSSALASAGKYILIGAGVIGGVAIAYELTKGHEEEKAIEEERYPELPYLPERS